MLAKGEHISETLSQFRLFFFFLPFHFIFFRAFYDDNDDSFQIHKTFAIYLLCVSSHPNKMKKEDDG